MFKLLTWPFRVVIWALSFGLLCNNPFRASSKYGDFVDIIKISFTPKFGVPVKKIKTFYKEIAEENENIYPSKGFDMEDCEREERHLDDPLTSGCCGGVTSSVAYVTPKFLTKLTRSGAFHIEEQSTVPAEEQYYEKEMAIVSSNITSFYRALSESGGIDHSCKGRERIFLDRYGRCSDCGEEAVAIPKALYNGHSDEIIGNMRYGYYGFNVKPDSGLDTIFDEVH